MFGCCNWDYEGAIVFKNWIVLPVYRAFIPILHSILGGSFSYEDKSCRQVAVIAIAQPDKILGR
jgi:predicted metalloprotease